MPPPPSPVRRPGRGGAIGAACVALAGLALHSQPAPRAPLPASALVATWDGSAVPLNWKPGETRTVKVRVRNDGDQVWPDKYLADPAGKGAHAVRLSHCWSGQAGDLPDCRKSRVDLPGPLAPGAWVTLEVLVAAPSEPGKYSLVFDLVEELVRWFGASGVAPLQVHAVVRAPPSPRALWKHAAHTLLLALGALALLYHAGFALSCWLGSRRLAPVLPLLMPVIGLAVLSAVGHALAYTRWGTDVVAAPLLTLLLALNGLAWQRGGRLALSGWLRGAWLAGFVALLAGLYPLLRVGYLTTVGAEIDPMVYVTAAEHHQSFGLAYFPETGPLDALGGLVRDSLHNSGTRQGDQYLLALLASLTRRRPHELFSVVAGVFYALGAVGWFALARFQLRLRPAVAALFALLGALQPLSHHGLLTGFFSQAAGAGAFPAVLVVAWAMPRDRSWRTPALAGLLLAGLVTLYPVYALLAGAALALAAATDVWRQARAARRRQASWLKAWSRPAARLGARLVLTTLVGLATIPLGFRIARQAVWTVRSIEQDPAQLKTQAGMATYPHPAEMLGLVSRAAEEHELRMARWPRRLRDALFLAGLATLAWAIAGLRGRPRTLVACLAATFLAALAQQRWLMAGGAGFPYGYFKIAALFAPFAAGLLAPGLARLARASGPARVAAAALLAAFASSAAFNLAGAATIGHWLQLDSETLKLQEARALVPPDEGLLWIDLRWPGRSWDLYLLGHRRNCERAAWSPQALLPEGRSPRLVRYALLANPERLAALPGEPWLDPAASELVWSDGRYRLVRRRDGALADVRLAHESLRTRLNAPLVISVAGQALRLTSSELPGGGLSQELEWCPGRFELALDSAPGARLWVQDRAQDLRPGEQLVSIDSAPRLELRALGSVQLLGVKALPGASFP